MRCNETLNIKARIHCHTPQLYWINDMDSNTALKDNDGVKRNVTLYSRICTLCNKCKIWQILCIHLVSAALKYPAIFIIQSQSRASADDYSDNYDIMFYVMLLSSLSCNEVRWPKMSLVHRMVHHVVCYKLKVRLYVCAKPMHCASFFFFITRSTTNRRRDLHYLLS